MATRKPLNEVLPDDVVEHLTRFLDWRSLFRIVRTCRAVHRVVESDHYWRVQCLACGIDVTEIERAQSRQHDPQACTSTAPVPTDADENSAQSTTLPLYSNYKEALIATTVPVKYAVESFEGAWLQPGSRYIYPHPDADATLGRGLYITVWWLDVHTHLIIPNGSYNVVLRARVDRYYHVPEVTFAAVVTYPSKSGQPPAAWAQAFTAQTTISSRNLQLKYTDVVLPGGPLKIESPTGYAQVRVGLRDVDSGMIKDGLILDSVRLEPADRPRDTGAHDRPTAAASGSSSSSSGDGNLGSSSTAEPHLMPLPVNAIATMMSSVIRRVFGAGPSSSSNSASAPLHGGDEEDHSDDFSAGDDE